MIDEVIGEALDEEETREPLEEEETREQDKSGTVTVMVNGRPVAMTGKRSYVFVDIFNYIDFDLSKPQGAIVTTVNDHDANYMETLHEGDIIEIYWRKP